MSDVKELLASLEGFEKLTSEELDLFASLAEEMEFGSGENLYTEGDPAGGMHVIVDGAVEVRKRVLDDLERAIGTFRAGGMLAVLPLIDGKEHPASGRAVAPTRTLYFSPEKMGELYRADARVGIKIFSILALTLCQGMRILAQEYQRTVEWSIQVSGATELNFHRLISDEVHVSVDLLNGGSIGGVLLKVERSEAGHELVLEGAEGRIEVVPYHAVAHLTFDKEHLATDAGPAPEVI
jgi:CRP-like cAMP-binding protein